MTEHPKGLHMTVLRGPYDATNGGISAGVTALTIVGWADEEHGGTSRPVPLDEALRIFEPDERAPAAIIDARYLHGEKMQRHLRVVPATLVDGEWRPTEGWFMFGGNYVAPGDSRWGEVLRRLTGYRFDPLIAVHDRIE